MIRTRLAQRYARAMFELARDAGKVEEIGETLTQVNQVLDSDESLRNALLTPVLTRSARAQILTAFIEAASLDPLEGNFLRVLLDAGKLHYLGDVVQAYSQMADELAGRLRGRTITRIPLQENQVDSLAQALSQALDKKVELDSTVDPSILGGVVVQVGNLVFDGSLQTQLRRMKETLTKG